LNEINPDAICRKTLRGKTVTNKDFALEVAKLSRGNLEQGIRPMTDNEIATTLGFKHYTSIINFKRLADQLGYFHDLEEPKVNRSTYYVKPDLEKFINEYESMKVWVRNMKKRRTGGKPFGDTYGLVKTFKTVCDTLKLHPDQFIHGANREEILENGIAIVENFMELYMQKKAKVRYFKTWNVKNVGVTTTTYRYAKAVRDFMRTHGFAYPDGQSGVMSQSITSFHGKYADVRFKNWHQYQEMKNYIVKTWGLDTDIFRWFSIGVEALPRASAIHTMTNNFQPLTKGKNEYYVMYVTETKTSQYNNGVWEKYIHDADTKKSIDLVKKRGDFVIENRDKSYPNKEIYPKLRQVYNVFKLDTQKPRIPNNPATSYFIEHTSHVLRHCGAQLWLSITDWDVAFVASMGWKKAQELIDSYGTMSADMKFKKLGNLNF